MTNRDKRRFSTALNSNVYLISSIVLLAGALSVCVWLMSGSSETTLLKNALYGGSLVVISFGLLLYSLFATRSPKVLSIVLWTCALIGVAAFSAGMALKTPVRPAVVFEDDGTPVSETVKDVYDS